MAGPRVGACRLRRWGTRDENGRRFCEGASQNTGVLAALSFSWKSAASGIPRLVFLSLWKKEACGGGLCRKRASGMDAGIARAPAANAEGRVGGRENDASLPRGARICCRCAGSTLFAPAGQKRFRVARLILGGSRGKAVYGAVCPSRTVWQARRKDGEKEPHWTVRAFLCEHPARGSAQDHLPTPFTPPVFTQSSRGETGGLCPHPLKGSIP